MTFDQIVAEVMDRLNLTSASAQTRVGKDVNDRYRRLTSSIGLNTSRRTQVLANAAIGDRNLTFVGIEKITAVIDKTTDDPQDVVLAQITPDEMHITPLRSAPPRHFCIMTMGSNTVTIQMDCIPEAIFTLYADGWSTVATLTGPQAPLFSESFHDILVFGAMADEYRKMEKVPLMMDAEQNYRERLSDLRQWIATSAYLDQYQGRYSGRNFKWTRDAMGQWDS